jgi:fumarylpyruvate hydrolase
MFAFDAPATPSVAVVGTGARFPVHRIYCVGRNYAEHAKEMGAAVERETPTFFMKPADAVVAHGTRIPYPTGTQNLHHEVEWVVALGAGARDIAPARALDLVFGYGVGLDLTRRDLQAAMKAKSLPWDIAKGFDHSAPISDLVPASVCGHPRAGRIELHVNGELRQSADIAEMIFGVPEIIAELSKLFELRAGDLIFTGTPSGVAALARGDRFEARCAGIAHLTGSIATA